MLTALVQYTPLTYRMLRQAILGFVPLNLQDFVLKIIAESIYQKRCSCTDFRIVCIVVIGKRHAVTDRGAQCDLSCKRNPKLADKTDCILCCICFCLCSQIIISLLLLVMGNRNPCGARHSCASSWKKMLGRLLSAKTFLVFVVLFLVFLVLYRYLPNRKASLKSQVPGHLLSQLHGHCFPISFHCILHSFRISAICMAVCLH